MRHDRVVLDTNVIVSGLILHSRISRQVVDHTLVHSRVLITGATQRELIAALLSPKFDRYATAAQREQVLLHLAPLLEPVTVLQIVRMCRDPYDDAVLEAALNGRADALVTGDKDLLELHPFRGIQVLTPAAYLLRITEGE